MSAGRMTREQRSHAKTVNLESYTVFAFIKQSNQLVCKESADLIAITRRIPD
jgi:hypothetical protein